MKILAVETSCDETSIAVISADQKSGNFKILSNIVSSQIEIHQKWGGVVPNLAAREHLKNLMPVFNQALKEANTKITDINLIAVTQGPGLIPALLLGINLAKTISYCEKKPLMGIHHLAGHIATNFAPDGKSGNIFAIQYPALALVVSGGHTQLILIKKPGHFKIIGQTLDDAVGEAFDKVAKLLELGYPGGPIVSRLAELAIADENNKFILPRPLINKNNFDFSFSGLKTAVLYLWKKIETDQERQMENKKNICQSFQVACIEVLTKKTVKALQKYRPKSFLLAGGVAANLALRNSLETSIKENFNDEIKIYFPPLALCGDNAAMIGLAALENYLTGNFDQKILNENWKNLEADSNLNIEEL